MNCSSVELFIGAALDDELDPAQQFEIHEHLENCASCNAAFAGLQRLSDDVRSTAEYHRAPEQVRRRVAASLQELCKPGERHKLLQWKWMATAASVLLAFSLGMNLLLSNRGVPESQFIAREVMSSHIRSLRTNHQVDVVSSDRHTVKPWFGDKLDFSPDVKDLASQGFPLVGGRVDYINGRPIAALVFQRSKHIINLFTWPANSSMIADRSQDGYHVVAWTKDGMTYWAVSDLNLHDLEDFSRFYKR